MIREYGFSLGLQMMTGLYGDTAEGGYQTARKLAALHPDSVRIYPTIIMRGTELGEKYLSGEFQTLSLEDSIILCARLLDFFEEKGIPVIRLGLHSSPELERDKLSGPWHPAFRELCESRRFLWKVREQLKEKSIPKGAVIIRVNPKTVSIAVGQKKENIMDLKELGYPAVFKPDHDITEKSFIIESSGR
jgi:histone acetyltransferase (RNA polymerase elongator complex component)